VPDHTESSRQWDLIVSNAHPRSSQRPGRCTVQDRQTGIYGVVSAQECSDCTVQEILRTSDRFVCDIPEQTIPSVCLSVPRRASLENRCDVLPVAEHSCVRVPVGRGNAETAVRGDQHTADTNSTVLARSTVVPRVIEPVSGQSSTITRVGQSTVAATSRAAPQHTNAQPSRLECIERHLVDKGISATTAYHVARSQRSSTMSIYESNWQRFVSWCGTRSQDPLAASQATIAEFLTDKFREGLSPSTVKGYKAAIFATIRAAGGKLDESDRILNFLLKSFVHERPVTKKKLPAWNLAIVLNALMLPPFEPMINASFKHLTYKAIFSPLGLCPKRAYAIPSGSEWWSDVRPSVRACVYNCL